MNGPECNKMSPKTLTTAQLNAIDLLSTGAGIKKTAEALNINRRTLSRWSTYNPYFIAALHAKRQLLWEDCHQRLRGMAGKAVDIIEQSLEENDSKTAVEVLKLLGIYGQVGPPKGGCSPEEVMLKMAECYAQDLLVGPEGDDPIAHAAYVRKMTPILTSEYYRQIKDNINEFMEEDNNETNKSAPAE